MKIEIGSMSKRILSVMAVLAVLACLMIVAFGENSKEIPNGIKTPHGIMEVEKDLALISMHTVCTALQEFEVAEVHVTISSVPSEGCNVYWETPNDAELSAITSNKGDLNYIEASDGKGAVVPITGDGDIILVFYYKTTKLENTLTSIINTNKGYNVAMNFGYFVDLPDGSRVEFEPYTGEEYTTFDEYCNNLKQVEKKG